MPSSDSTPLLPASSPAARRHSSRIKLFILLAAFATLAIVGVSITLTSKLGSDEGPEDPLERANWLLGRTKTPIIDGHIDLPEFVRMTYKNNISAFDLNDNLPGHVDIPRLREGKVGGFFWSCFTACPEDPKGGAGSDDFLTAHNAVRDTLEQIDVAKLLIEQYSDTFALATTAQDVRNAISKGKIASLLGIEGAHQLGNSLASIRQFAELGVRYVTLTHSCPNAFADSGGIFNKPPVIHGGLSPLGRDLVYELNRLGVMVDLSHVSDQTALQALELTRAPVIWSHSSARHYRDIQRNVPDHVLEKIGTSEGKVDGVIHINFYPAFIQEPDKKSTVKTVADHVEWIAKIAGHKHVGLGSDFDGIESVPEGLEDVSKYPALFAELIRRGWTDEQLEALAGGNTLRILEGVEKVREEMKAEKASMGRYLRRKDL